MQYLAYCVINLHNKDQSHGQGLTITIVLSLGGGAVALKEVLLLIFAQR